MLAEENITPSDPVLPFNEHSFTFVRFKNLGHQKRLNEQHLEAMEWYSKAYVLDPKNFDLLFSMATSLRVLGRLREHENYVREAHYINPTHFECLMELGLLEMKTDSETALHVFEKAERVGPVERLHWVKEQISLCKKNLSV